MSLRERLARSRLTIGGGAAKRLFERHILNNRNIPDEGQMRIIERLFGP